MFKMKYSSIENLSKKHKNKHEGYEHTRLDFVYKGESEKMGISAAAVAVSMRKLEDKEIETIIRYYDLENDRQKLFEEAVS